MKTWSADMMPSATALSRVFGFALFLLVAAGASQATAAAAAGGAAAPARNLALHRSYELTPPPNYAPTRNAADARELTDGQLVSEREGTCLWQDQAAVGWSRPREPIVFTIDLGQTETIGGVAVHSAFGSAGVCAPRSLALLVSDDGEHYRLVGDLVRLDRSAMPPAYGTYARHTYRAADALRTQGRFVRLVVVPAAHFFFCDEIEIFSGDDRAAAGAGAGGGGGGEFAQTGSRIETAQLLDKARLTQLGAYVRIRTDLEEVEKMIGRVESIASAARDTLSTIRRELDQRDELVNFDNGRFRAIVPLNDLHEQVFAVHARLLAACGAAPLTVWHSPPYQILDLFVRPGPIVRRLSLELMLNERRAEVFNITNAAEHSKVIRFDVSGLPGGSNPAYLRAFEVPYVDTRESAACASALLALKTTEGAERTYQTAVPAGMTRQIWLAFEPRDIAPGRYEGKLRIRSDQFSHDVQIDLNVAPIRFPDRARLNVSMWDYIADKSYSITGENQPAARQFVLDDPLINGVECGPKYTPLPGAEAFDAEGNLVAGEAIDFSRWDAFVKFWPSMPQYHAFPNFNPNSTFAGTKIGTPAFDRAVSQWAAAWAEHNRTLGLKPGQVVLLFVDEPNGDDWLAASWHFANAFRQGTRDILTFTDPQIDSVATEWGRKNAEVYDIVCPHLPDFVTRESQTQAAYTALAGGDRQLWFYSCSGPARMFDPSYYRLQPWHAYLRGATGSLFWALGDASGTTSWNEYAVVDFREAFTPIYIGVDEIDTSKHYEAAREGIMDYEYLRLIEDRIEALKDAPSYRLSVQRARRLLRSLPSELIQNVESRFGQRPYYGWNNSSAPAEDARVRVLRMLVELSPRPSAAD